MTQDNNGLPEPIESGTLPYADLLNHELPSDYCVFRPMTDTISR
jgi:hypothetical protein